MTRGFSDLLKLSVRYAHSSVILSVNLSAVCVAAMVEHDRRLS